MRAQLLARRRNQPGGVLGRGRVKIESEGYLAAHGLALASRGRELCGHHHLL